MVKAEGRRGAARDFLGDGGRRRSAEPDEPHGRSSSALRLAIASRTSGHALAAPSSSHLASPPPTSLSVKSGHI